MTAAFDGFLKHGSVVRNEITETVKRISRIIILLIDNYVISLKAYDFRYYFSIMCFICVFVGKN